MINQRTKKLDLLFSLILFSLCLCVSVVSTSLTRLRRDWRLAFLLLTVLMLSSCASAKRGDVHGKVSYGGRPGKGSRLREQ